MGSSCLIPLALLAPFELVRAVMDFHSGLRTGGTFNMFVLVLGDNLVDSWYRSRTLGHVVCEVVWIFVQEPGGWMDFRPGTRRLDGLSSWNPNAGWTFVLEPGGWMDFRHGTRMLDGLSSWNPEAGWTSVLEPGGWLNFCPGT
ncbi:hypothetical protein HID58_074678 [Brassica napus]|uniref:S-protein homolog n=1 Tax=Brassica napus TaxID=3708 RepID=A0ABQ7YKI7_BRANA|nr:hypothetical protein HID58_074678 [Brassica napus]